MQAAEELSAQADVLLPGEFVRVTVCIAEDGAAQGIR